MRYTAIGDSFTEGVGDNREDGSVRGWADLVAAGLARALAPEPVEYANLAIRGRLLRPIVTEQLDAALALDPRPDVLTLNGGGNDMLRPGIHIADLLAMTRTAVERATAAGVRVVLIAGPNPSEHLPLGRMIGRRGQLLTEGCRVLAAEHGLTFVDCFNDLEVRHARYWSPDRLHLNSLGHERVAGLVLHALGHGPAPAPAPLGESRSRTLGDQLQYYREHVVPFVQRRIRGTSSGDNRVAKHPTWHPIP